MPSRNQISMKHRNQRSPVKNRSRTNKTSGRNAGNNLKTNPGAAKLMVEQEEIFDSAKADVAEIEKAGAILVAMKSNNPDMFKIHTWNKYSLEEAINEEMEEADAILAANAAKKAVKLEKAVEMEILLEKWLLRLPMTPIEHCEYLHWAAEMARS